MSHILLSLRRCVAIGAFLLSSAALSAQSVTLSSNTVGSADNSTPFFGAKSDVVEIPAGKRLTFKFTNNNGGATENYYNWLLAVVNTQAHDIVENSDYKEYFVLRPDNWGWGGISDYPYDKGHLALSGYDWATFPAHMDGASVEIAVKRFAGSSVVMVEAKMTKGNVTIRETYYQSCPSSDTLYAYLSVERAHLSSLTAEIADCAYSSGYDSFELLLNPDVKYWFAAGAEAMLPINSAVSCYGITEDGSQDVLPVDAGFVLSDGKIVLYNGYNCTSLVGKVDVAETGCAVVGNTDLTTAFNSASSDYVQVRSGETKTVSFQLRSDNAANWHCPVVILRTADKAEYATLRADNFGYRELLENNIANEGAELQSDWDWPFFRSSLDGSVYTVSVSNYADTVSVLMDVVDGRGQTHHQYFRHIGKSRTVNAGPDDLYFGLTTEGAYLLLKPSETTGLRPASAESLEVVVDGRSIDVVGADSFEVYDLKGRRVAPRGLAAGVYVVRAGGAARRVLVR